MAWSYGGKFVPSRLYEPALHRLPHPPFTHNYLIRLEDLSLACICDHRFCHQKLEKRFPRARVAEELGLSVRLLLVDFPGVAGLCDIREDAV